MSVPSGMVACEALLPPALALSYGDVRHSVLLGLVTLLYCFSSACYRGGGVGKIACVLPILVLVKLREQERCYILLSAATALAALLY